MENERKIFSKKIRVSIELRRVGHNKYESECHHLEREKKENEIKNAYFK